MTLVGSINLKDGKLLIKAPKGKKDYSTLIIYLISVNLFREPNVMVKVI